MEIINWLNANDGAIMGIATVVLVCITGYYAYLALRLLKANGTPEIAISLRPHEAYLPCVMLRIENIGTGEARNIRFRTDLSFKPDGEKALEELGFLKNGIDYLGPGQKIEHFLVSVADRFDELKETPLEISVTYTDSVKLKRKHERTFYLDFGESEGYSRIGKPPLFEIAEATKRLQQDLNRIATGSRKPVILTESLFEHRIQNHTDFLETRISQFPRNIQDKILQKVDFFIDEQEREIREKIQKNETETDANSS